jgi:signal transduction histidine kinase/CheY-like chemotaxis protein
MLAEGSFAYERLLTAALILGFALLFVAGGAAMVLSNRAMVAEQWVRHSLEVRRLDHALRTAVDTEALGERGYLITGDQGYLDEYKRAKADLRRCDEQLHRLERNDAAQTNRLGRLDAAINSRNAELAQTLAVYQSGRRAQALDFIRTRTVERAQRVSTAAAALDAAEARLLAQRERQAATERNRLLAAIVVSLIASAALALFVVAALRRTLGQLRLQNATLGDEIRRRESSEAQFRQSQKMEALGRLTGGIAHDFNNMLAIVIGNLDMLSRRLGEGDAQLRGYVEHAQDGAQRAASLTQSLLAYSRQQPLDPKPYDVNRSMTQVSKLLRSTLGETIALETVLAPDLWPAFVDGPQLESAIVNLAVNARDAMPAGGKLTLETMNIRIDEAFAQERGVGAGAYVLVALTDTGAGMTPEVAARAFDPFFSTKAPGAGTGLGLSQVQGFVRQSGGHVQLYSEPGVGTTVKLYLPRAQAAAVDRSAWVEGGDPPPGERARILVVEDEASVRAFVRQALEDLGHTVLEADGMGPALEVLQRERGIRLMLTDVVMPGGAGRELSDAARRIRPDLPIVFMTGYTRDSIVHDGVLDPDADLIPKPFTLAQLAAKVSSVLAGARRDGASTPS